MQDTKNPYGDPPPKTAWARVVRHLDHICSLKIEGYKDAEIAFYLKMKRNTYHYAFKKAEKMLQENPDLYTAARIPFADGGRDINTISDESKGEPLTTDHEQPKDCPTTMNEPEISNDTRRQISKERNTSCLPNTQGNNADHIESTLSQEDWAAEVMRTAKPSKYAHKFNIELKHQ